MHHLEKVGDFLFICGALFKAQVIKCFTEQRNKTNRVDKNTISNFSETKLVWCIRSMLQQEMRCYQTY